MIPEYLILQPAVSEVRRSQPYNAYTLAFYISDLLLFYVSGRSWNHVQQIAAVEYRNDPVLQRQSAVNVKVVCPDEPLAAIGLI